MRATTNAIASLSLFTWAACGAAADPSAPDAGERNRAPVAHAGDDRTVGRGARVAVDGRRSFDPDGEPLTFSWVLASAPPESAASLADLDTGRAEITPDVPGVYELSLVVDDGDLASEPDLVRITAVEGMPVAYAGEDRTVARGTRVVLDGRASSDPDGDPLSYAWTLDAPAASAAVLEDDTHALAALTPDAPGQYLIELVVDDGWRPSAPDRVIITARNSAPVVSAGEDREAQVGDTVLLIGTATDEDGDPLELRWTAAERPAGSAAEPAPPSESSTSVALDEPGEYRFLLTASDGFTESSDEVRVLAGPDVVALDHDVVDAEYSRALERIVLVSDETGALSLLDPETGAEDEVELALAPLAVSVSPDGLEAVVGHDGWVSVVDLVDTEVTAIWPITAVAGDIVHGGNGYAYVVPAVDQWEHIRCVALGTGVETLGAGSIYAGARARRHPTQNAIYLADRGLSPSDIEKHSIAGGTSLLLTDSPYHGDYAMCGDLWYSEDGLRIYTRCGNVFRASTNPAVDMTYNGSLSEAVLVDHLDHSAAAELVAARPANHWGDVTADTRLDLYDDEFLAFEGSIALPSLPIDGVWVPSHGRFVFFGQDGAALYVVMTVAPGGLSHTVIWQAL